MSDENRDASGQFAPSTEGTAGREYEERQAGYIPYTEPGKADAESAEDLTVKDAADELAKLREQAAPESEIRTFGALDGLPENTSLTADQAAKILADDRKSAEDAAEAAEIEETRREVDKLRGQAAEDQAKAKTEAEAAETSDDPNVQVEKFLAIPHVREAVDKMHGEIEGVRETYSRGVDVANHFAQAAFIEGFPEIAGLPVDQWEGALAAMAQREPDRFGKAMGTLQRVAQLQALQEEQKQFRTDAEQRDLQQFVTAESTRFNDMIKGEPKEKVRQVERAIVESIQEYGGDSQEFFELLRTTKIVNSAVAQRLLYDAGQYRLISEARVKAAPKSLPPVQRPGASQPRITGSAATVEAARAAADRNPSVANMAKLLDARRRAAAG